MTASRASSKEELLFELRRSAEDCVRRLRALDEGAFEQGRYESGWNGRQILAHIASIEWTYPRLIELAKGAQQPWASTEGERRVATARGGIDAYNQREVEKRAQTSTSHLIGEFERNRATLIAAVEAADEALFMVPVRSAGGVSAALGRVLLSVAVAHVIGHVDDITGTNP